MRQAAAFSAAVALAASVAGLARAEPVVDAIEDEVIDDGGASLRAPSSVREGAGAGLRATATERFTTFLAEGPRGTERFESRTTLLVGARSPAGAEEPWRADIRFDLLGRASADLAPNRGAWDLEARPWELWWRTKLGKTSTVTLGYQSIAWGTLEAGAAADVFASYDLRLGPSTSPADVRMPLPAARLVWSPSTRADVEVVALPFFTPHRFDVAGTRYAAASPASFGLLARAFDAGTLARVTAPLARANGVDANPTRGEAGARATWHTSAADVALTVAWARSRFPSYRTSEALRNAIATGSAAAALRLQQELDAGALPLEAVYDGYVQTAVDAQGAIGGVAWGVEAGVSSKRTLISSSLLDGDAAPRAHVAQAGLRASKTVGTLALTTQFAGYALLDATSAGAIPVGTLAFGKQARLGTAVLALRYEHGPWVAEASGLGACAGPLDGGRSCAEAALFTSGRFAYAFDAVTISLAGAVLARTSGAAIPLASPIDQLALRLDWCSDGP